MEPTTTAAIVGSLVSAVAGEIIHGLSEDGGMFSSAVASAIDKGMNALMSNRNSLAQRSLQNFTQLAQSKSFGNLDGRFKFVPNSSYQFKPKTYQIR